MANVVVASDMWIGSGEGKDGVLQVSISAPLWHELLVMSPQQAEFLSIGVRNCCLFGDRFSVRTKAGERVWVAKSNGWVTFQRGMVRSILSRAEALLFAATLRGEAAKLLELTRAA
jgi:hypothetical protein